MSPVNSSVVIAKALRSQGYTPYVANLVKNYWNRNCNIPHLSVDQEKTKKDFSEKIIKNLDKEQRKILGAFIGFLTQMNFDTGLRIGLATSLVNDNKN